MGQGGAERQLYYTLKALRQADVSLQLLCLTQGEYWETPMRALGVPIVHVGQSGGRLTRLRAIIAACRQHQAHIIQSQHFYTNPYASAAARVLGAREIGAIRNNGAKEVSETGRALGWLSLQMPRFIAANSQGGVTYARQHRFAANQVFFLPNVIDSQAFAVPSRTASETLRFLTIGRLEPQKRVDRLLNLLAQFQKCYPQPFRLVIAGEGSLRPALEQQARDLGLLPEQVEFRGAVNNTAPLYRDADIFLLTSDYEGTPNVVMEAMAAGLPVVSSNVGGVLDLVQHESNGLLCEPNDQPRWLDALLSLAYHPARRIKFGDAARHYIEAHHSLQRLPQLLNELYQRALR